MRARIGCLGFLLTLVAAMAQAQQPPAAPKTSDVYCSGVFSTEAVPKDTYLISGEQSNHKIEFSQGNVVFINRGSDQGVKVGEEFLVLRAEKDPLSYDWFASQPTLRRAMGTLYTDRGRVRVIHVRQKVSIAEVSVSCDSMQRGDLVRPFAERVVPPFKGDPGFDRFAPVSGKPVGMVVGIKPHGQVGGAYSVAYVNLGSAQGAKVGDYVRVFRYQGTRIESVPQSYGMTYKMYGFGSTPVRYKWDDLPREVLGEGIVLRVSPNAATVLLTASAREIYAGDYLEIE